MLIRSISGIRGLVNSDLTLKLCRDFAIAINQLIPDGFIMILISKSDDTHLKTLLSDYRKHFKIVQNIDLGIYQKNQSLLIGQK